LRHWLQLLIDFVTLIRIGYGQAPLACFSGDIIYMHAHRAAIVYDSKVNVWQAMLAVLSLSQLEHLQRLQSGLKSFALCLF